MTFVLYSLAAVWVVLVLAWALYVAPTGGPLGPLQLAIALVPSAVIVGSAVAFSLVPLALRWLGRTIGKKRA